MRLPFRAVVSLPWPLSGASDNERHGDRIADRHGMARFGAFEKCKNCSGRAGGGFDRLVENIIEVRTTRGGFVAQGEGVP
jgi:hypothetical protein